MKVVFYVLISGRVPVKDFLIGLPPRPRAECFRVLERIEEEGLDVSGITTRQIQGKLWELKVRSSGEIRIFYFVMPPQDDASVNGRRRPGDPQQKRQSEESLVLLHGYMKKTQKAPKKEIAIAKRRMKEVAS